MNRWESFEEWKNIRCFVLKKLIMNENMLSINRILFLFLFHWKIHLSKNRRVSLVNYIVKIFSPNLVNRCKNSGNKFLIHNQTSEQLNWIKIYFHKMCKQNLHSLIFWLLIFGNFSSSFLLAIYMKLSAFLSRLLTLLRAWPNRYKGSFFNFNKSSLFIFSNSLNFVLVFTIDSFSLKYDADISLCYIRLWWTEPYVFFMLYRCFHNMLRLLPLEIVLSNPLTFSFSSYFTYSFDILCWFRCF